MIVRVDIDNTICHTDGMDYENSKPFFRRIQIINDLYNLGHTVIYWTSRGVGSGNDYSKLTENQLNLWGCLYHKLELNKPLFDTFIDDKAFNSNSFFNEIKNH